MNRQSNMNEPASMLPTLNILFIKPRGDSPYTIIDLPLGILYLSAYLKKHLGNRVCIDLIDLRLETRRKAALRKKLAAFRPDIIGVGMLNFERNFLTDYGKEIAECAPGAEIVLGGPYATIHYENLLLTHRNVSCVVLGEGEATLLDLIQRRLAGKDISDIPGIARRDGDRVILNPKREYIRNLDDLPWPDYELIDMPRYWGWFNYQMNLFLAEKRYAPVMSSRACPYHCNYCHNMFGKEFRPRSPEHFVGEIRLLYETYGVREFHIVDDIFNLDRPRMHAILNLIIKSGMKIRIAFPNGVRSDLLTHEDILLLKKAGAYMITFAIETGSDRMQKQIRKHLDIPKAMDNIAFASGIGLLTKGYFMLGFPGETVAEMRRTVDLAVGSKLDLVVFFMVVPFFGTGLYDEARRLAPELSFDGYDNFFTETPFYEEHTGFDLSRFYLASRRRFYSFGRSVRTFRKLPRKTHVLGIHLKSIIHLSSVLFVYRIRDFFKHKTSGKHSEITKKKSMP